MPKIATHRLDPWIDAVPVRTGGKGQTKGAKRAAPDKQAAEAYRHQLRQMAD